MKVLVWLCALVAGLGIGSLAQRYRDERDFILVAERFRAEARRAGERCDEATIGMAEALLEYRGGPRKEE